jgi:hypothetical protein
MARTTWNAFYTSLHATLNDVITFQILVFLINIFIEFFKNFAPLFTAIIIVCQRMDDAHWTTVVSARTLLRSTALGAAARTRVHNGCMG